MCGRCRHVFNAFQFLERVTESIPIAGSLVPTSAATVEPVVVAVLPPVAQPVAQSIAPNAMPSPLETFEFEISEPLKTVQSRADALLAAQKASEDAFEESLKSIIDGQSSGNQSGATSYAMGQTTTFSEPSLPTKELALSAPVPVPVPIPIPIPIATDRVATKIIADAPKVLLALPSSPIHSAVQAKMDLRALTVPAAPFDEPSQQALTVLETAASPVISPKVPSVVSTANPVIDFDTAKSVPFDLRISQNLGHNAEAVADDAPTAATDVAQQLQHLGSATNPLLKPLAGATAKPASRGWVTALYAFGCVLLAVGLAAQCAYHFRDTLVAQFPVQRGLALQACAKLNCVLPWSRNLDAVVIKASDLLEIPGKPGQLVLSAILANRSAEMQDYPLFEVMLTDNTNRTVTSRVFTPQQYLARALKPDEGFAPNTEIALTLNLDAGAKSLASGYNMQVVY